MVALDSRDSPTKSHALAQLAGSYVWLVAGASALHFVAANQDSNVASPAHEALCSLVLRRVLGELSPGEEHALESDHVREAELDRMLLSLCDEQRMLSLCPVRLAGSGAALP